MFLIFSKSEAELFLNCSYFDKIWGLLFLQNCSYKKKACTWTFQLKENIGEITWTFNYDYRHISELNSKLIATLLANYKCEINKDQKGP